MQGSDFVGKAVNIAAAELRTIATPGQGRLDFMEFFNTIASKANRTVTVIAVSELELQRAKKSTKSAILTNLESRVTCLSFLSSLTCYSILLKLSYTL